MNPLCIKCQKGEHDNPDIAWCPKSPTSKQAVLYNQGHHFYNMNKCIYCGKIGTILVDVAWAEIQGRIERREPRQPKETEAY